MAKPLTCGLFLLINLLNHNQPMTLSRFADLVHLSSTRTADPLAAGIERFVGLEHIEPENLHIRSWGNVADGVTFTNKFKPGQVLFGKRRAYQRKVAVADFEGVCSSDIYVFESKDPNKLLPELLPFICQSEGFFEYAVKTSAGSLSPRTNWKHLAEYEFPLPPVDEQRRIADLLWATDDSIVQHDNAAEKLYGVFSSKANNFFAELQQNNVSTEKLKDLCAQPIVNGIFRRRKDFGEGIRLVNVTDIYSSFRVNESSLDRVRANEEEQERYSAKPGDVIFNRSSLVFEGVGHACLIPETQEPLVFECHLMRVRPNTKKILPEYLARLSLAKFGRNYIESVAKKTTMTTMNQQDLNNMPILVPDLNQQKIIVEQLDHIELKIEEIRKHIEVLRKLKSQMLNRLLTG